MAASNMCVRANRLPKAINTLFMRLLQDDCQYTCRSSVRTFSSKCLKAYDTNRYASSGVVLGIFPRSAVCGAVRRSCINARSRHQSASPKPFVYLSTGFRAQNYSTQETEGTRLTEQILKSRTQSEQKPEKEESQEQSDEKEKKKDSWFSGKNAWKLGLLSLTGMGFVLMGNMLFMWGAPALDADGTEIVDEFSILPVWQAYPKRAWKEFHFFKRMIQEPSSEKLLPDPLKEPYVQPPYTLVLEMTDVLVHPDWTLNTGWRFKKRPAVDYFLQQIGPPLFEVVIYTREQGFTAFPILNGLDPNGFISYRLFRDATLYREGTHVKDLGCLNRDLSKVIIIDCDPKAFGMHPRNGIQLKAWKGGDEDRTLVDLATFLRTIGTSGVEDVRTVLDHYNQFDDPLEAFKDNQRKLQEQHEEAARMKAQDKDKSLVGSWSFGLTGRRK